MSPFIYIIIAVWQNSGSGPHQRRLVRHKPWERPCNAYQDGVPLMCTQHRHKPVHNTGYMLKVCLQRQPLQHSPYSKSNWFTEFCKSLCLSQFTASFISVWAKASIAECFDKLRKGRYRKIFRKLWGNNVLLHTIITPQSCYEDTPRGPPKQTSSVQD